MEETILTSIKYMYLHMEDKKLTLSEIARTTGYSDEHFCRSFKKYTGLTVMQYFKIMRMYFAVDDLREGCNVLEVAYKYNYSKDGFIKAFKSVYGVTPVYVKENKIDVREYVEEERWVRISFWIHL